MIKISVVMPVYNSEKYISESIESVLKQSFADFEFILVDDGSTDNTIEIIESYTDPRIKLLKNNHDFINSLNIGIKKARGKYIARMDSDDVMHIDRLKIQYNIMEQEDEIAVCGSWMKFFSEKSENYSLFRSLIGIVQDPLILLLGSNIISHPTTMIRKSFLQRHTLRYQNYPAAEDYKLWVEIAKKGGKFYVESQPLLYYRLSESQVSVTKKDEQLRTTLKIKKEILEYLISVSNIPNELLVSLYRDLDQLSNLKLFEKNNIYSIFQLIFLTQKQHIS